MKQADCTCGTQIVISIGDRPRDHLQPLHAPQNLLKGDL